jgi:hypothetical protein
MRWLLSLCLALGLAFAVGCGKSTEPTHKKEGGSNSDRLKADTPNAKDKTPGGKKKVAPGQPGD